MRLMSHDRHEGVGWTTAPRTNRELATKRSCNGLDAWDPAYLRQGYSHRWQCSAQSGSIWQRRHSPEGSDSCRWMRCCSASALSASSMRNQRVGDCPAAAWRGKSDRQSCCAWPTVFFCFCGSAPTLQIARSACAACRGYSGDRLLDRPLKCIENTSPRRTALNAVP